MTERGSPPGARVPRVALVATGDELVQGRIADANSSFLARRLVELGFDCRAHVVLGDDEDELAATIARLATEHDAVIVGGGLGPTLDDVTRHAAARAAKVELATDARVLDELRELWRARGRPFLAANERQALFPRGAEVLANPAGTAPGFVVRVAGADVYALPGPPHELAATFETEVVPRLERSFADRAPVARRSLHLFGIAESELAALVGDRMRRDANPLVGVTAKDGVLSVSARAVGATRAEAEMLADASAREIEALVAPHVFSRDDADLARALVRELLARSITIATAESCTGGLLAGRLTSIAGVSAVLGAGWVTYANATKERELGVPSELLARHGAVSRDVAEAMARGAAERSGARLALSITGVAGPGGGTPEKPVGLVCFGVAFDGRVASIERRFVARDRELVRAIAVNASLDLARRTIAPSSARKTPD